MRGDVGGGAGAARGRRAERTDNCRTAPALASSLRLPMPLRRVTALVQQAVQAPAAGEEALTVNLLL